MYIRLANPGDHFNVFKNTYLWFPSYAKPSQNPYPSKIPIFFMVINFSIKFSNEGLKKV